MNLLVATALTSAFTTPMLSSPGATAPRVSPLAMSSYVAEKSGSLGGLVGGLEAQCKGGDNDACLMLDQLSGYAQALTDMKGRRSRAPDAPTITNEKTLGAGASGGAAATSTSTASSQAISSTPDSVAGALVKLFNAYDRDATGFIALETLTSRWASERMDDYTSNYGEQQTNWEARQARAGARRIERLFAQSAASNGGKVPMSEFVGKFMSEYDKRIERGLPEGRAVAEINCNLPQRAVFAEMYGSE